MKKNIKDGVPYSVTLDLEKEFIDLLKAGYEDYKLKNKGVKYVLSFQEFIIWITKNGIKKNFIV